MVENPNKRINKKKPNKRIHEYTNTRKKDRKPENRKAMVEGRARTETRINEYPNKRKTRNPTNPQQKTQQQKTVKTTRKPYR